MKLIAKNIFKSYQGRNVVNDVSIEVNQGEIIGLLGPNGAGKTTTFYTIVGLIKPDSGNITVDNNWDNKLGLLSNTINNYLSYNFSQMFSFIKVLDICEENISLTIYGKVEDVDKFNELIFGNFYEKISIIYKQSEENYFIFCRNKTCSNKLKNLEELNNHINKIYEF